MSRSALELDCVIFGGGAAGLFTLARLRAEGCSTLLLERDSLGAGQTRCAQGIIHGGIKYSLGGLLGGGSRQIAEMPERWRRMAEGAESPSLAAAQLRSPACWLWRSDGIAGRLGMLGAKLALRAKPEEVAPDERPEILRGAAGAVLRLPEPVFDPCSVLEALAASQRGCVARYRAESLEVIEHDERVSLRAEVDVDASPVWLSIRARCAILAAGIGNEGLRERCARPVGRTQRRPLHQVLVRSPRLPLFDGHCIDGDATRVTITSARDEWSPRTGSSMAATPGDAERSRGVVWHLGGRLAEEGVSLDRDAQIRRAAEELRAVLPAATLDGAEFAAYRIDRAEPLEGGHRPEDARLIEEGPVLSLWPVKLALAPRAAELAAQAVGRLVRAGEARQSVRARGEPHPSPSGGHDSAGMAAPPQLPHGVHFTAPTAAPPPWHDALEWTPAP